MANVYAINQNSIVTALGDYARHTDETVILEDLGDGFISRLAEDCTKAKTHLRNIFRRVNGWDEQLQAVVVNGNRTHDPNPETVRDLALQILRPYLHTASREDYWRMIDAVEWFAQVKETDNHEFRALNYFAPQAYRPGRKMSRIFRDFCKAVGVVDETRGSDYQRFFAQLADEMSGRKIDFKLFLSINPAHFITMSNPLDDKRGETLISCHSLNRDDYAYNCGNAGYARDDVTFVTFTAANPDEPETLNNRKTSRQLFMYRDGVLLQSRLYTSNGGVHTTSETYTVYRDLVERVLCEGEGVPNLWHAAQNYDTNKWGIRCNAHNAFGAYPDWRKFGGEVIKLTVRKDVEEPHGFTIGNAGLCYSCGEETYGTEQFCDDCNDKGEECNHCGCRLVDGRNNMYWVHNETDEECFVCGNCLDNYYFCCEECGEYHHVDNGFQVRGGNYVCNECCEEYYRECDECGCWERRNELTEIELDGETLHVCESCLCDFEECEECGRVIRCGDVYEAYGRRLCEDCFEHCHDEDEDE